MIKLDRNLRVLKHFERLYLVLIHDYEVFVVVKCYCSKTRPQIRVAAIFVFPEKRLDPSIDTLQPPWEEYLHNHEAKYFWFFSFLPNPEYSAKSYCQYSSERSEQQKKGEQIICIKMRDEKERVKGNKGKIKGKGKEEVKEGGKWKKIGPLYLWHHEGMQALNIVGTSQQDGYNWIFKMCSPFPANVATSSFWFWKRIQALNS